MLYSQVLCRLIVIDYDYFVIYVVVLVVVGSGQALFLWILSYGLYLLSS